jgi:HD-like signal output (HDOD) protein
MLTYNSIIENVKSLPPLSNAALQIQTLYIKDRDEIEIIKLVRLIESDALLTANVLKMINSPYYGFSKKIASVSQAVTLFGIELIRGIVIKYAINEKIKANLKPYGISTRMFNDICHLQSALMMQWYSKIDLRDAQYLTPLALIMETGKIILSDELIKSDYTLEFKQGFKKADDILAYEYDLTGTTSYYISALLFEHWNLDSLYVEMLKNLDFKNDLISSKMEYYIKTLDVVRTAVNVKEAFTKESIDEACNIVSDMNLDVDYFHTVAHRIKMMYIKKRQ